MPNRKKKLSLTEKFLNNSTIHKELPRAKPLFVSLWGSSLITAQQILIRTAVLFISLQNSPIPFQIKIAVEFMEAKQSVQINIQYRTKKLFCNTAYFLRMCADMLYRTVSLQ